MTVNIQQTTAGLLLPVRAYPNGRQNAITGIHAGQLKVQVTAVPEKGKANKAIIKLLAAELDLKRSNISLHKGSSSQQKMFVVVNIASEELRERICNAVLKSST